MGGYKGVLPYFFPALGYFPYILLLLDMEKSTKIALISGSIIAFSGIVYFWYKKKAAASNSDSQLPDNNLSDLEKIYNQLLRTIGTQQQQPQTPQQLAAIKEAQAQEQAKSQFQPQSPQSQFQTQPQKKQPQPQPQPQKPQTQEYKTQSGYYASGYGSYGSAGGGYSYGGGTNTGYSVYSGSIAGYGSNAWWLKDRGYGGIISDYAT